MQPIYRIAKWTSTFETADSRRHRSLKWFSVPIGFSSNGYAKLIEDFGDEAPAIYGAWIALVNIAAACPVRGILSTSSGVGLTVGRLSLLSHFPSTVFGKLIEWGSSRDVGWLEVVTREEFNRLQIDWQSVANQSANNGDCSPNELHDKTGQNPTKQNTTTHYTTEQPVVGQSSVAVVDFSKVEREEYVRQANKLLRVAPCLEEELIWQIACIGTALDRGFVADLIDRFKSGGIRAPRRFAKGALRKACEERGHSLVDAIVQLPSQPKLKQHA